MKRSWWVAGLASCLSLAVSNAYAHDVQLNFQGKVTESTCTVESSKDVKLHSVSANAFKTVGDVASIVPFGIIVADCDGTKVAGRFAAITQDLDYRTGALINKQPGGSNVQVQIASHRGEVLNLGQIEAIKPAFANETSANFQFLAQYISADEIVTAGDFSAKLMFDLVYE
ncbi:type 1 fimbrial protein [Pseudomonas sp. TNT2022 ID357]|uniref:Type 1 fimbrial protein n=1 Tax=Pseudomonas idahonensis TaxID=2942628 RepID=A0ABT5QAY3_9PSED|nr:fimbrial protein [Pseudomonas idahonensis]MDD1151367.1 type 1 fimbrial protein [Pseudomonas idahonensis]